jgi:spermidine/putrescine transport system permease protein
LLTAYPVAYILFTLKRKTSSRILSLLLIPMWINILLRTYAWLTILEKNGIINFILSLLKIKKIKLLYKTSSMILGMTYDFLPIMILPLYNSFRKIDKTIIETAKDLGANDFLVFTKIIFPLTISGIYSGFNLVFMSSLTTFVIPDLLGGGKFMLIGNLIEKEFLFANDWHLGSSLSVILVSIIIFTVFLLSNSKK